MKEKKVVIYDESSLLAPEWTEEQKELQKQLYELGKPIGYKPTVVVQRVKETRETED